ncbi:hypothetical protein BT63DRAFT_98868 [Microthyrium microscopicum]|uniref:G-patch domain-containing protein n=1 Tax=Microthyrium microscopicum TaxID=703497 RepID=A0A6A6TVB4_9PEZI|nr:hypothetical protein BT63DRAFT_98868 [Microthyrium microscopicum]
MDASAHLKSYGWRGLGYSLDTHDRGLARPLLVSHKTDARGLGSKRQAERQADQWWLRAFDAALRGMNDGSGDGGMLESVKAVGVKKGGLYGHFTRGEVLGSTFDEEDGHDERKVKRRKKDREAGKERSDSIVGNSEDSTFSKDEEVVKTKRRKSRKAQKTVESAEEIVELRMKAKTLSDKKRMKYAAKAEAKGITFEEYSQKRFTKKSKRKLDQT